MSCQVVNVAGEVESSVSGDLLEGGQLTNVVMVDLHVNVVARLEIGVVDRERSAQWHDDERRRALHDV